MKKHITSLWLALAFSFLIILNGYCLSPKMDPIKFRIVTSASNVSLNEEFEITITAEYLNVSPTTAFVLKDANNFKLKLTLPDGFVKTGGDYHDFIGTELSPSRPKATYKLKGKFVSSSSSGIFELLRSHKNADNQSTFVAVGALTFNPQPPVSGESTNESLRIAAVGDVQYMTIAELRGASSLGNAVVVTDNFKQGLFILDAVDNVSPDNDALTLVTTSGKRYKRQFNGTVNVKWFGITAPDGTTDEHTEWQAMLNDTTIKRIYVEKTTNPYRVRRLFIRSNTTITFEDGVDIFGLGNLLPDQRMINIWGAENITLQGKATIRDIKENYPTGAKGQYNGCIYIQGGKNITIDELTVRNCGGDAFYVGSYEGVASSNVTIRNCITINNNRMGVAIISAVGLFVENCKFLNHNGSNPAAGIDIEPNNNNEKLINIRISNCYTANNAGTGVLIAPNVLRDNNNVIDVVVDNHTDDGSLHGAMVGELVGELDGTVVFKNCTWKNSIQSAFLSFNWSSSGPKVIVDHPVIINSGVQPFYEVKAAILIYKRYGQDNTHVGNIDILNPVIRDLRETPYQDFGIFVQDEDGNSVEKVSIIDPIDINAYGDNKLSMLKVSGIVSDRHGVLTKALTANHTTTLAYKTPKFTNTAATGQVNLTLAIYAGYADPVYVTIECTAGQPFRIIPTTSYLRPILNTTDYPAGSYLETNEVGSRITMKKVSIASWVVTEIIGKWTDQNGKIVHQDNFPFDPSSMVNQRSAAIGGTTDINTITENGIYNVSSTTNLVNRPSSVPGKLTVVNNGGSIFQMYEDINSGRIRWRSSNGGSLAGFNWKTIPLVQDAVDNFNPPNILAGGRVSQPITVTGASIGDYVRVAWSANIGSLMLTGHVSATNEITYVFYNPTGAAIDLPSGFAKIRVEFAL